MEPMVPRQVVDRLNAWLGRTVFIHLEVNPGAYWRNGSAQLRAAHVKGDGPYRVFLELENAHGLIQVDGLTHMALERDLVVCIGLDEHQRLARTIEIGLQEFSL
ncbi:MAG: YojF family protein [Alicyclobacillus sp.]|nr:YojF family protein [Alicyclobacillus sp.]